MASPTGAEPEVLTGPGSLLIGEYGVVVLPTDTDFATWPITDPESVFSGFTELGFTTSGHGFTYSTDKVEVRVAERLRPIRYQAGSTSAMWTFSLAQYSPSNIAKAIPGAVVTAGTNAVKVTLPKSAGTTRYSLIHVSESGQVVHVIAKAYLTLSGEATMGGVDSGDPLAISVEASIEEAATDEDDVAIYFDDSVFSV